MEFDGEMSLDVYNGVIYANAGGSGLFAVDADNLKLIWGDTKAMPGILVLFVHLLIVICSAKCNIP